ncbi:MAG TPA: transglutaminase family protein [Campylobacteraceae bacterium]|nr:transglutaminase family protein [Campylobacteraceae bacterium]
MMLYYKIFHKTEFNYTQLISFSHNLACLKPRDTARQQLLDFEMEISPQTPQIHHHRDYFDNYVTYLEVEKPHRRLTVTTTSLVRFDRSASYHKEHPALCDMTLSRALKRLADPREIETIMAKEYCYTSPLLPPGDPALKAYAASSFAPDRPLFEAAREFMGRIYEDFAFTPGFSDVTTPVSEVFVQKKGVCQDFAHLAITALRMLGLPARYVSGYIETLPPEGEEKLFGVDASHAWYAIYFPGVGWIGFDPTNNLLPKEQHIVLGWGRDYGDVVPLRGVVVGTGHSRLSVSVDVRRVAAPAAQS